MTKNVRIENADTSSYKVKVDVQERQWDPEKNALSEDWVTVKTVSLDHPTSMATEYLTDTRRFIVREEK